MTLLRLLGIEIHKTWRHPALWSGLLALLGLLGMFVLVRQLQVVYGVRASESGLEKDLLAGLAFYNWVSVLVYAVIGAVIAGYDYPDRSIQLWLGRGVGRSQLLAARLVVILFFGLLITCFTISSILVFGAFSRLLLSGTVASNLEGSALLPVTLRAFWSGLPYLALALLLAIASRSPLVAAAGTIVYGCVFERLALGAGDRFPALVRYLPVSLSQALQASNAMLDRAASLVPPNATQLNTQQASLCIGVIFCALSAAALIIFLRQDLGGS